ncbi:hypothetical protein TUM4438_03410 [Shewanella sairae]|uniref:Uncharacterized protein n=1 Tax=Shewanella sairae TaxID=190310 RepID=A0ABQ4P0D8_9GAMM|nr:hypothetical protein [Shewanella sairae]MCL1129605.1 hypothetical protein [Shewanella sairae]GIU40951.1 hypothetical protein TUM4438_03410 [Shewanella sairae]
MNYSTTRNLTFSGRMAIVALILSIFAFAGQVKADEFTAKEQAAIAKHQQILEEQIAQSEHKLEMQAEATFVEQVKESEQEFMALVCTAHGLDADRETGACYE